MNMLTISCGFRSGSVAHDIFLCLITGPQTDVSFHTVITVY